MEGNGEKRPSVLVMSAIKSDCTPKLSKELKIYKRPLKTTEITDYFGPSDLNVKAPVSLQKTSEFESCGTPNPEMQTLFSNSPLDLKRSQELTVTTLEIPHFTQSTGTRHVGLTFEINASCAAQGINHKRNGSSAKEAKSHKVREQEDTSLLSGKREIAFEFTDSEEEERINPGNKHIGRSMYYSCKHCDYNDVNINNVSAHYLNKHPYIRHNQVYIQDPSDQSATFRCLNCPIEFLTLSSLTAHHAENHHHSPSIFTIQSDEPAFKCFVCSFTCSGLEEVRTHYKETHPTHEVDNALMFCRYSVDTYKKEQPQSSDCFKTPMSARPQPCSPTTSSTSRMGVEIVPSDQHQSSLTENMSPTDNKMTEEKSFRETNSPYQYPEEQLQLNDSFKVSMSELPQQCSPTASSTLGNGVVIVPSNQHQSPPAQNAAPVMMEEKFSYEGENPFQHPEQLFYCQVCNYANVLAKGVLTHQVTAHRKSKMHISLEYILEHTAKIRDEIKHLPSQAKDSSFPSHLPLPILQSGERDAFFCHLCNYRNGKMSLTLRHYFEQHNHWKIKSDQVRKHSLVIHKQINDSHLLEQSSQKLPNKSTTNPSKGSVDALKKRKEPEECSEPDSPDSSSPPTPRSNQGETRTHSCKACSYKCTSISEIAQHCRAVHPWSVKEDGSVLYLINKRKSRARNLPEGQTENIPSFESYQVPLEFESTPQQVVSPKRIQCLLCPDTFGTQRCANAHYNKAHRDVVLNNSSAQMEEQSVTSFVDPGKTESPLHVFKCPYCPYVHSKQIGVFGHCSMCHPGLELTTESCDLQTENIPDIEMFLQRKGSSLILRGYMCKNCPQIYAKQKMLTMHCQEVHCESDTTAPQSVPKSLTLNKKKPCHSKQKPPSKALSLNQKKIQCQRCPYKCTKKLLLARHTKVCHKAQSSSVAQDCLYKCAICPSVYSQRNRLERHYIAKHGKKSLFKYLNVTASTTTKGSVSQQSNSKMGDSPNTSKDNTVSVNQCPECPYVNITNHGFLMHCQKKHPFLIAHAKKLLKKETIVANFDKLKIGTQFKCGGYKCKKCLYIYYSVRELKSHWKRDHNGYEDNTSVLDKPENEPIPSQTPPTPQQNNSIHQCKLCPYIGLHRKYLSDHYKKKHKMDLKARRKIIESDTTEKGSRAAAPNQADQVLKGKRKTGPTVEVRPSPQLLSQLKTFQPSVSALDFIVLAEPSQKSVGLYKCFLCGEHVSGTRKLCSHLDRHRQSARTAAVDLNSDDAPWQDELPVLETIEDLAPWNVTSTGPLEVPQSPLQSPENPPVLERMEPAPKEDSLACRYCGRMFKYQKGLASHERSHHTVALIRKQTTESTSTMKHNINKYIIYKATNRFPFLCALCRYSTTFMSLLRRHLVKKHECIVKGLDVTDSQENNQNTENEVASPKEMLSDTPDHHLEDLQTSEGKMSSLFIEYSDYSVLTDCILLAGSSYLEAPVVKLQLDHYNQMAQARDTWKPRAGGDAAPAAAKLQCDVCWYSTGRLATLRKHYWSRHKKKMRACRDCSFLTTSKTSMKRHRDLNHDSSRQLPTAAAQQDFSCPFCLYQTKNRNYMIDHVVLHREERVAPIEPRRPRLVRYLQGIVFRCHKCTFTSGSAESLRLHAVKHNDVRPYKCRLCYFDCTQLSELEAHLSDKHQVLRNHELVGQIRLDELEIRAGRTSQEEDQPASDMSAVPHCEEAPSETQMKTLAETTTDDQHLQMKDACQGTHRTELKDFEPENRHQAQCFSDTGTEKRPEATAGEGENAQHQYGLQIQENRAQLKPRSGDKFGKSSLKEKIERLYESSVDRKPALLQKQRTLDDHSAKIEEHILSCVLQLEKEASAVRMRRKSEMDLNSKVDMKMEAVLEHNRLLLSTSKTGSTKHDSVRVPSHFTLRRHSLPHIVQDGQHESGTGGVSSTANDDHKMENPGRSEKVEDYGRNEGVAEQGHLVSCCWEEDQDEVTHPNKKPRLEEDGETNGFRNPCDPEGALCSKNGQTTLFACDFCGRKLASSCQLERHIVQHGK